MSTYSADELWELATHRQAISEWLRNSCSARHAEDMADVVHKADQMITDLASEQEDKENSAVREDGDPRGGP